MSESSYLETTRRASQGRLNAQRSWVAAGNAKEEDTWLEVNIGKEFLVTRVLTQGDPYWSSNYFRSFYLEFSFDGFTFLQVKVDDGDIPKVNIN